MTTPTLRWGILGTGGIARKFAAVVSESTTGTLVAVGSRAQASANAFGSAFGATRSYPTYDALLADKSVEAVYISLPNHLHAAWIEKCARTSKHMWFPGPGDDNVIVVQRANKDTKEIRVPGKGVGLYTHEVDLVAWCVAEGQTEAPAPAITWHGSLNNMKVLDAWRNAAGLVFDAEK